MHINGKIITEPALLQTPPSTPGIGCIKLCILHWVPCLTALYQTQQEGLTTNELCDLGHYVFYILLHTALE